MPVPNDPVKGLNVFIIREIIAEIIQWKELPVFVLLLYDVIVLNTTNIT
jgi:hypothetical protein